MKRNKISLFGVAVSLLLTLLLAACGGNGGEAPTDPAASQEAESAAPAPETSDAPASQAGTVLKNGDLTLTIPEPYADLLVWETPENDPNGILFSVSEKASVEAGKKDHPDEDWGDGWLFDIRRIDQDELDEMMSYDASGSYVFAEDEDGMYYVFGRPTDVRFFREGDDYMSDTEGIQQWSALNEWAEDDVRTGFIEENKALSAYTRTNTDLDINLYNFARQAEEEPYTISATSHGLQYANGVDKTPYLTRLLDGATFRQVDEDETPDGEFYALDLPYTAVQIDFFLDDGNYIRETYRSGATALFQAEYADRETRAWNIVADWYDEMVKHS